MDELKNLTRRSGLVTGAKLAFAAPAIVAGLRGGVVFADDTGTGTRTRDRDTRSDFVAGAAAAANVQTDSDTNAGEHVEADVLGHARICSVNGANNEVGHAVVGQLRLIRTSTDTHLAFRLRGGGDRVVTIADSPSDLFNGKTLTLKNDRAMLFGITSDQVSKLIVADTHQFATGFKFTVPDGANTLTFVTCPENH